MCIFYILHELTGFNSEIPEGKRNARIFMLGIILYCLVYILIINIWDKNYIGNNMRDAIFWTGLVLFLSDVSIMGYIYKSYYGRSITNEIADNQDDWLYDDNNHKYYQLSKIKIYKDKLDKKNNKDNKDNKNNNTYSKNPTNIANVMNKNMELEINSSNKNIINILDNDKNNSESSKSLKSVKSSKSVKSLKSVKSSKSVKSLASTKVD
jgi:hypothetical protein